MTWQPPSAFCFSSHMLCIFSLWSTPLLSASVYAAAFDILSGHVREHFVGGTVKDRSVKNVVQFDA